MGWWGKLLGGAFGFMVGGPIGALIGAALGHNLDVGLARVGEVPSLDQQERAQAAFFTATFSVMGHIAKADGRVSEDEIRLARGVMDYMALSPEHKVVAKRLFRGGKSPAFSLDEVLDQLREECHRSRNLLRIFVEIQLQAAYADGALHPEERRILGHICDRIGLPRGELERLEAMLRAEAHWRGARGARPTAGPSLDDAYGILGVDRSASDEEVKKAYRRLMNRHHPDKLVAKGLPEEMMKLAKEKTQEIKAAYDRVMESRAP